MTTDATLAALTAGLDEDEAIARAATGNRWHWKDGEDGGDDCGPNLVSDAVFTCKRSDGSQFEYPQDVISTWVTGAWAGLNIEDVDKKHIARQDPARTLRQVQAIRRVVADYHDARDALNDLNDNQLGWEERARVNALESTLSALASIYTQETEKL